MTLTMSKMIQLRNASLYAKHCVALKHRPELRASISTGPQQLRASVSTGPQQLRASISTGPQQLRASVSTGPQQLRASVSTGPQQLRASVSTGPQQQHGTFYEFRTYFIQPHLNSAFLKLTNENINLRTAHSELIGYWTVEYGGLNQVFHIWKYDSYAHRASVRAALAQDPSWIDQYISKAIPMLSSQDNEVTYLVPWSKIQKPPKEGGVYELVTFQMKPGGPAVWGRAFQTAVATRTGSGYSHSLGVFHSEFGQLNQVHVLWWYESADQRAATRRHSHEDARVVAAVRESSAYLVSQKNKLMFPCAFSPMK